MIQVSRVTRSTLRTPVKQSNPAVNKRESPARKNPKNIPFSVNTTSMSKANPPYRINSSGLNKSQKLSNLGFL